jgi:hypothetical protein
MSLSDPADCVIYDGECMEHVPCCMLQIFSLELAKIPMDGGSVELYGYIAVRDELEPLLNYVVNFSRDEPIIVEQVRMITSIFICNCFREIYLSTHPHTLSRFVHLYKYKTTSGQFWRRFHPHCLLCTCYHMAKPLPKPVH